MTAPMKKFIKLTISADVGDAHTEMFWHMIDAQGAANGILRPGERAEVFSVGYDSGVGYLLVSRDYDGPWRINPDHSWRCKPVGCLQLADDIRRAREGRE